MASMQIREATEGDAAAMARLLMDANPHMVVSAASWLHRRRTLPAEMRQLSLVAEVDGEVVARAQGGLNTETTTVGAAYGGVIVDRAHRRRGIGTALYERLEAHLREIGATTWPTFVWEDAAGIAFAERHGFRRERAASSSVVDPRTVTVEPPPSVEVASVAEVGPEVVYAIDTAGMLDEPAPDPPAAVPLERWQAEIWDEPDFARDGSMVAGVDGRWGAISFLYVAPGTGRAVNAFTATLPELRGRGLALAAKAAALRWAAANGIERVSTANDETNAAMLAINRRLGYEPLGRVLVYRRELRAEPSS